MKERKVRFRVITNLLPNPRIDLSEIIDVFQTVVIVEQTRQRLKQINGVSLFFSKT